MPICTIELNKGYLERALDKEIASTRRQITTQFNPAMKQILEQDLALLTQAKTTIKEKA